MNTRAYPTASMSVFQGLFPKSVAWLAAVPLLTACMAQAQVLDVHLWQGSSSLGDWKPSASDAGNGSYSILDTTYSSANVFSLHLWNTTVDSDPFISANVSVVNNTAVTQTYTLVFTLPVSPIAGATLMGGSTQGGLSDANFDGSGTLSTVGPGTALFYGQIDGVNVLPIFADPFSMVVAGAGASTSQFANVGLPGPTLPSGAVVGSIGIEHQFTLTAGDSATFTSVFAVVPAPEPSTLSLLALSGLMFVCRRRR